MKSKFLFFLGVLFFAVCSGCSENENESDEDLPEGKWNGEYMEVESEEDEDKKRPSKKSNGSEILNLGTVTYTISDEEGKIIYFEKRKNDLIINENQITIRIKDANDRFFLIGLHKDKIYKNPEGKYIDASSKKDDEDPHFSISYIADLEEGLTFQCTKGTLEVKEMNFKSGKVDIEAKGEFLNMKNVIDGNPLPFELKIKMRFETVVSAFNPNKQ
jgi:hypothetical protein